jgi:hypothetical protein
METSAFSKRIRVAFLDASSRADGAILEAAWAAEPAIAGMGFKVLAEITRDPINVAQRDAACLAVVRNYQNGPRNIWGPVLLEMFAPALVRRMCSFSAVPPRIQAGDIEQQMLLEILVSAERGWIVPGQKWVDQRLVKGAGKRVSRWLRRAVNESVESIEEHLDLTYEDERDEIDELEDLGGPNVRSEDLLLVYRAKARLEPLSQLARERGVSYKTLSAQLCRARARLRGDLAA